MKLVSYNIQFGTGLDRRVDLKRIADTVKDADIIALQEVERFWQRSGMADQPAILAQHLKNFHWVFFPAFDMDASEHGADGEIINRRRQFGPMVMSRWPILSSRLIVFPKLGTADTFNMDTGAIECVIDTPSGCLRVYSLHLSAISARERVMQIDHLLEFHRTAQMSGGAWTGDDSSVSMTEPGAWSLGKAPPPMPTQAVVMGDFNSEPESEEYIRMVGGIDPYYGRVAHLDSFADSWLVAREHGDDRATWYSELKRPCDGGMTLDYCFVTPDLMKNIGRVWVDQTADGSDHLPYWIGLDW